MSLSSFQPTLFLIKAIGLDDFSNECNYKVLAEQTFYFWWISQLSNPVQCAIHATVLPSKVLQNSRNCFMEHLMIYDDTNGDIVTLCYWMRKKLYSLEPKVPGYPQVSHSWKRRKATISYWQIITGHWLLSIVSIHCHLTMVCFSWLTIPCSSRPEIKGLVLLLIYSCNFQQKDSLPVIRKQSSVWFRVLYALLINNLFSHIAEHFMRYTNVDRWVKMLLQNSCTYLLQHPSFSCSHIPYGFDLDDWWIGSELSFLCAVHDCHL